MQSNPNRRTFLLASAGAAALAAPFVHAAAPIRIRLAHSLSANEPAHQAALFFAENVAKRTNDQVMVQVFPSEQLGSGKEVNEMVRQGANVMNNTDFGYLADFVPDVGIINGPYLMKAPSEYDKIIKSAWFGGVEKKLESSGIKLIMKNGFFGGRHMLADKAIRNPADLAGMTVRVPPNPMWIETFKSLGARPTVVQWSEVYSGLAQNVVQAVEAPVGTLYGSKLQEVRKVLSLTNHFTAFVVWPINAGFFNKLPKDLQAILLEEGHRAGDEMKRLTQMSQDSTIDKMKAAGVTVITDVNMAAMRAAVQPTYKAFPKWTPGLYETVMATMA